MTTSAELSLGRQNAINSNTYRTESADLFQASQNLLRTLHRFENLNPADVYRHESGMGARPPSQTSQRQALSQGAITLLRGARAKRIRINPDAEAARRRMLAGGSRLPLELRQYYSEAHRAVLTIVALEVMRENVCALSIDEIAAKAGVGRTSVQDAFRRASSLRHIEVKRRPQRHKKSLTNIVTITSKKWLEWVANSRQSKKLSGPKKDDDARRKELNQASKAAEKTGKRDLPPVPNLLTKTGIAATALSGSYQSESPSSKSVGNGQRSIDQSVCTTDAEDEGSSGVPTPKGADANGSLLPAISSSGTGPSTMRVGQGPGSSAEGSSEEADQEQQREPSSGASNDTTGGCSEAGIRRAINELSEKSPLKVDISHDEIAARLQRLKEQGSKYRAARSARMPNLSPQ